MLGSNQQQLDEFLEAGRIHVQRGSIFETEPSRMSKRFSFDRVAGMMLGLGIGDALGVTTEGMLPRERLERFGEIRDYLPNRCCSEPIGFPSDDSQMAFWTLEQMLVDGSFVPGHTADRFCQGTIHGHGRTVARVTEFQQLGFPWHERGATSAGNGALTRIAPMLIPHVASPSTDLWADTALSAMITHNDPGSIAACLSFVSMLWQLMDMQEPPAPEWWVREYVKVAQALEGSACYRPRCSHFAEYEGPIWRFAQNRITEAIEDDLSTIDACSTWDSGAYLLETVPSVLYILTRHADDPEEAIVRAINDTRDNDTVGAIVGAAIGALHGQAILPRRWIDNLSGRTSTSDDGRMFQLLQAAERRFCVAG